MILNVIPYEIGRLWSLGLLIGGHFLRIKQSTTDNLENTGLLCFSKIEDFCGPSDVIFKIGD